MSAAHTLGKQCDACEGFCLHTPTVLHIIRTAAADCAAQGNNLASNELLDAAAMVKDLLKTMDVVADGLSADGRTMDGMTKAAAATKLRASIAKANGAAS